MKKNTKNCFATLNPAISPVVSLISQSVWASAGFALLSAVPGLRNNFLNVIFSRPFSLSGFLPVPALGAFFGSVSRSDSPKNEGRSDLDSYWDSTGAVTLPAGSGGENLNPEYLELKRQQCF